MSELSEKSIQILELPQVLTMLAGCAVTEEGKEKSLTLRPMTDIDDIQRAQDETSAAVKMLILRGSPGFSGVKPVAASLQRADMGGSLNTRELTDVAAVLRAARLLEEAGADYNILTVVTEQLARHIRQVYAFYKKQGWRYQQYIPCLDPLEAPRGSLPYSLTPARYGAFLEELFDLWCADLLAGDPVSIRYFDNLADLCRGYPPESCGLSGVCACQHVVEADGSVYPCDFYVLDAYRLGNILTEDFQELDQSPRLRTFVEDSLRRPEECESCSWLPFCGGGCRRERDPVLGRAESPSVYCSAYRRFLPYALPRLRRLTQRL